jgi:hypothetical protein
VDVDDGSKGENFMNPIRRVTYFVAMTAPLLLLGATSTRSKHACDLRSIEGDYGFVVNGTNVGAGLVSAVGLVTTDGTGKLSATDTVSANGVIIRRTITGSYTVNENCTGTTTFIDNFGQTTHLDFVATDDRQELQFIQTDPGTVTTGIAKKR